MKYPEISKRLMRGISSVRSKALRSGLIKVTKWSKVKIIQNLRKFAKENKLTYENLEKSREDLLGATKIWKETDKEVSLGRIEHWIYLNNIPYSIGRNKNE